MHVPSERSLLLTRVLALALAATGIAGTAFAQDPVWTGSGSVGLSLTRGNSDTVNYNLAFDLTHDPDTRNVMKWTALCLPARRKAS